MWRDDSGYLYTFNKGKKIGGPTPKIWVKDLSNEVCFINCGGTCVSVPHPPNYQGVSPATNLRTLEPLLNTIGYVDHSPYLSEEWTEYNYIQLRNFIQQLPHKMLILSHGTDMISYFGPWVDLISKKQNLKAIVIVGQRSLDKPTSQFNLLLNEAIKNIRKVPMGNCVVLTTNPKGNKERGVIYHSPYQIKKYHTTRKGAFYGKNSGTNLKKLKLKLPYFEWCSNDVKVAYENLYDDVGPSTLRVCGGVGNPRSYHGQQVSSFVNSGPLNPYMYRGNFVNSSLFRSIEPTWEAYLMIRRNTNLV